MSELGMSVSAVSAAGAYVPVRAIDPVRRRFPTTDEAGQSTAESSSQQSVAEDESSAASRPQDGNATRGGGFGLLGAFTSFLASLFSQPEAQAQAAQSAAPSMQAATAAYARTANAPVPEGASYEVMSPSMPRLSSGRAFDLSV